MKTSLSVQTAKPTVDIVIVTWNNINMLDRCICSIMQNTGEPVRIVIVNNGDQKLQVPQDSGIKVLDVGKNIGWTEGVNFGVNWVMENDPAPFVMWLNDDVQILPHDYGWLAKMINCFELDDKVAAVGPASNNIMGFQSTNYVHLPPAVETTFLSGMCMLVKLDIAKEFLPLTCCPAGGDDLDFSIRLTQKGLKLCICRRAFMLHFCSATGKRIYGQYWNSNQQGEDINTWLIKKHGFKVWFNTMHHILPGKFNDDDFVDYETNLAMREIKPIIESNGKILDLGCGGKKIHAGVIGVDIRKNGQVGVGINFNKPSSTDVEADVLRLPFEDGSADAIVAKHLLEHVLDPISALTEWARVLKDDGKLVILCPDYRYCEAISVDPSHVHAFTPASLESLAKASGLRVIGSEQVRPGYVFMSVLERSEKSSRLEDAMELQGCL